MLNRLKDWWRQLFLYPKKKLEVIGEDYNAYWRQKRGVEPSLSAWQKKRGDLIIEHLRLLSEDTFTIADIGSGDGVILAYILQAFPNATAIGYDSSEVAHELAQKAGIQHTKFLNLKEDIDLDAVEMADYVLLLETLEHIPEAERVLQAAHAKALRGVFFSFPNTGFFTFRIRLFLGKFPAQWIRMPNEHLRFWTYQDVKWWLKAQNFSKFIVHVYEGVPLLRNILPGLFGAGLFVFVPQQKKL